MTVEVICFLSSIEVHLIVRTLYIDIPLFNQHLLYTYCVPGTMLSADDTRLNNMAKVPPALVKHTD